MKICVVTPLTSFIIAVSTVLLFYSPNGWAVDKEKHLHAEGIQKVKIQRFGVDGVTLEFIKTIAEIGDGWSGANGLMWKMVEPQPPKHDKHYYRWEKIDNALRRIQMTGRRLQVNIRVHSDWAIEHTKRPIARDIGTGEKIGGFMRIKPEHLSDWAAFITEFVERYDADGYKDMPGIKYPITHIQIESEPDIEWVSSDGYIEALCTAYQAAKKACPGIQIMAAGFNTLEFFALSPEKQQQALRIPLVKHRINFSKEFFSKAEAGTCYDILSLHLERDYKSLPPTVKWFQQQMEANGYKKPIWSEDTASGPYLIFSISYGEEGKRKLKLLEQGDADTIKWFRQEQAKLLIKKAVIAFASGVDKVFISSDMDWPTYWLRMWKYMGLLDAKGNPKPAFYSFKIMVSKLDGFTKVEQLALPTGVFAYCFTKPSGKVYVLWSEQEKVVNLPLKAKSISVTDISGRTFKASPSELHISASPVFVEGRY